MSRKFVECGILKEGVGLSPIVCDPSTGDLIFCDDLNGNCIMSNLSITDPLPMESDVLTKIKEDNDADGVILSESYIIILKDGIATYRNYGDALKVIHEVEYDTDIEYEGSIDFVE